MSHLPIHSASESPRPRTLMRQTAYDHQQAKAAHAFDNERQKDGETHSDRVLPRAEDDRETEGWRVGDLSRAVRPQLFDRLVQLLDLLSEHTCCRCDIQPTRNRSISWQKSREETTVAFVQPCVCSQRRSFFAASIFAAIAAAGWSSLSPFG